MVKSLQPLRHPGQQLRVTVKVSAEVPLFAVAELLEFLLGQFARQQRFKDVTVVHTEGAPEVLQRKGLAQLREKAGPGAVVPVEAVDDHAV